VGGLAGYSNMQGESYNYRELVFSAEQFSADKRLCAADYVAYERAYSINNSHTCTSNTSTTPPKSSTSDSFAAALTTILTSERKNSNHSCLQVSHSGSSTEASPISSIPASPQHPGNHSICSDYIQQRAHHIHLPHHLHQQQPQPYRWTAAGGNMYTVPGNWSSNTSASANASGTGSSGCGSGPGTPPSLSRVPSPHLFAPTYAYGFGPPAL
jgi:hypothetical protein